MSTIDRYKHLFWTENTRILKAECRIFDVYEVQKSHRCGKHAAFFELDAPQWVTSVPLLEDDKGIPCFVMVRQFRHGSGSVTLEFPAGVVESGEEPLAAAIREFREETGYECATSDFLGSVNPNPAFMNNRAHFFLLRGIKAAGDPALDEHEEVETILVPVEKVIDSMGSGEYDNGVMMIALAYYLRWKRLNS